MAKKSITIKDITKQNELYPVTSSSLVFNTNGVSVEADILDIKNKLSLDKGYFTNEQELLNLYPNTIENPEDRKGWHCIVGSTDTIWIWDIEGNKWKDSFNKAGDVTSVNNLTGDVVLTGQNIDASVTKGTETVATTITGHLNSINSEIDTIKDTYSTNANVNQKFETLNNNKASKIYVDAQDTALSNRIDEIELFKFPNATIVGTPTIQSGQVSGFNANNYMIFPFIVNVQNRPFKMQFCFTTGNDITTQQNIIDSEFGIAFAIQNSKLVLALSSNGTSWDLGVHTGQHEFSPNGTYYCEIEWTGTEYTVKYSTNNVTFYTDIRVISELGLYPKTIYICGSPMLFGNPSHPFGGTLNMNKCFVYVDDLLIWQGMDDAGLATRADIRLSNIDADGEQKIIDVVNTLFAKTEDIEDGNIKAMYSEYADNATNSTNATNATNATNDGQGNQIDTTYATKIEALPELSGNINLNEIGNNRLYRLSINTKLIWIGQQLYNTGLDRALLASLTNQNSQKHFILFFPADTGLRFIHWHYASNKMYTSVYTLPKISGESTSLDATLATINDIANMVTTDTEQTITGTKKFAGASPNITITPAGGATTGTYSTIGYDGFTTRNGSNFFKTEYNTTNYDNKFGYKLNAGNGTKYISIPDKTGTLAMTDEIPTKTSELENDSGFITEHQSLSGLATESYVDTKVSDLVNSAPETLDTLKELADALGDDPNFSTTITTELGKKANTADLSTVATSGSYNDLSDKPTIPDISGKLNVSAEASVPSTPTNLNTLYNAGLYGVKGVPLDKGAPTSTAFYGSVLVTPYNSTSGKTQQSYAGQLAFTTGDYTSGSNEGMWYRGSKANTWNDWKKVATTDQIPSKTSDLTNDSGYITSSDIPEQQCGIIYIDGNTTGTAGLWTGTSDKITELVEGMVIGYKVGIAGASSTTLEITNKNGVSLGAKRVYRTGTNPITTHYAVGTYIFVYYSTLNSGCFYEINGYDANSYAYMRMYNLSATNGDRDLVMRYDTTAIASNSMVNKYGAITSAVALKANPKTGELKAVKFTENGTSLEDKYQAKITDSNKLDYSLIDNTPTIPSAVTSVNGLSGGTISSTVTVNGYVTGTWLQTTATTDNANWTDVFVNSSGWLYKRSKDSFKSDLGIPTKTSELTNDSNFVTSMGNVAYATFAYQDVDGNSIIDTYLGKSCTQLYNGNPSGTAITVPNLSKYKYLLIYAGDNGNGRWGNVFLPESIFENFTLTNSLFMNTDSLWFGIYYKSDTSIGINSKASAVNYLVIYGVN